MIQFVLALIGILGAIVWIGHHPLTIPESTQVQELAASVAQPNYFDETGMVVLEETGSRQHVPWIVYQAPQRPIATKQLVFSSVTTCDAGARVLPCAGNFSDGEYPVQAEQRVRIQGWIEGEKVLVERISYL